MADVRRSRYLLFAALAFVLGACAPQDAGNASNAPVGSHAAQIDDVVTAFLDAGQFNGSVLVAEAGEVIY